MPLDPMSPAEILKVTLMVAVGALVLKTIANATGVGKGLTGFLPGPGA